MNTLVNFEIAKLLKEKNFNEKVFRYFDIHYETPNDIYSLGSFENWNAQPSLISAPTIAEVVIWLYEKHGIWIYSSDNSARLGFMYQIQRLKILGESNFSSELKYDSPTEAYEAAIEYCLKNLI